MPNATTIAYFIRYTYTHYLHPAERNAPTSELVWFVSASLVNLDIPSVGNRYCVRRANN